MSDYKKLENMVECLEEKIKLGFDSNTESVDVKAIGEVADALKDLAEAKYKLSVVKAMDEYKDEEDMPEEARRYYGGSRGRARDSRGRFMYTEPMMYYTPYPYMRDMDRDQGRMYYSDNSYSSSGDMSNRNMSSGGNDSRYYESRYDRARRNYTETRDMHRGNTTQDKDYKVRELETYMNELASDLTDLISDMSAEEKTMMRTKLSNLSSKIQ